MVSGSIPGIAKDYFQGVWVWNGAHPASWCSWRAAMNKS